MLGAGFSNIVLPSTSNFLLKVYYGDERSSLNVFPFLKVLYRDFDNGLGLLGPICLVGTCMLLPIFNENFLVLVPGADILGGSLNLDVVDTQSYILVHLDLLILLHQLICLEIDLPGMQNSAHTSCSDHVVSRSS